MSTRFAIFGDGSWGTAIAVLLSRNPDYQVRLWSAREDIGREIQARRENVRFLPGIRLPDSLQLTTSVAEAIDSAEIWISAIPTVYLRPTWNRIRQELSHLPGIPCIVSLTKGLELESFKRPSEIITEILGDSDVVVLSGPSHAEEVSRGLPCSVVAASGKIESARRVQQLLTTDRLRVYTNLDPLGVELSGALKNVLGVAAGISEGLGFGDNALSALITRGLAELTRFGVAFGANPATFVGLAGIGDLITTCISEHGRNRAVGIRLAGGEKLSSILASTQMVAEGVTTAKAVHEQAVLRGLEMPICEAIYQVLYEEIDPRDAVTALMLRSLKEEKWPT
ncbi:MAG: NAD(P)H-dependent glycerol-3-phosphate dehydrogenase [Gemmataceae bacterium]